MAKATPAKKKAGRKSSTPAATAHDGTQPDGTKVVHVMADGTKITNAVWQDGKVCCPTCHRKLPKVDTAARIAKRRERAETLRVRAQEEFRHIADLIKKNARGLGEPEPSDADILKIIAAGAAQ